MYIKKYGRVAVGESLLCKRALKCFQSTHCSCEKGTIIGYLSRKVSRVCSLFSVRRGGTIKCTVAGRKKY